MCKRACSPAKARRGQGLWVSAEAPAGLARPPRRPPRLGLHLRLRPRLRPPAPPLEGSAEVSCVAPRWGLGFSLQVGAAVLEAVLQPQPAVLGVRFSPVSGAAASGSMATIGAEKGCRACRWAGGFTDRRRPRGFSTGAVGIAGARFERRGHFGRLDPAARAWLASTRATIARRIGSESAGQAEVTLARLGSGFSGNFPDFPACWPACWELAFSQVLEL